MSNAEFDVVIYGATGFTGRLVAEYLASEYGKDIAWAMAGRSEDKLKSVRDEIGAPSDTPLIVADASDPATLKAMAERTRAVITTVGPYQLYGEALVKACVEAGTDYVDLSGEPAWMQMARKRLRMVVRSQESDASLQMRGCNGVSWAPWETGKICNGSGGAPWETGHP